MTKYAFRKKILMNEKKNNLYERLFFIQTRDLFEFNNICLIQTKYIWVK